MSETAQYRTDVDRATQQTRWMLCSMPWLLLASLLWPLLSHFDATRTPAAVGWWTAVLSALQGIGATTAVACTVGRAARPRALVAAVSVLTLVELVLFSQAYRTGGFDGTRILVIASIVVAIPPAFALAPVLRSAPYAGAALAETAACGAVVLSLERDAAPAALLLTAITWLVIGALMRSSLWFLAVLWQLNAAREVQARLVVAEERLRFARDLHDVIGRTLSVVALKAELAERLAQNATARAELAEVQSLTRGLHKEIRDVIKGYRTADLSTELQGARSVLEAAGITCRIHGDDDSALSEEIQTALAWVVREGVTNVLRHSHASHCAIRLARADDGATELTITNDGIGQPASEGSGSGLAGLVERLAPLGGTLRHGPRARNTYRLSVRIPKGAHR
ncbi:histidine kinase [Streptomyces sp. NPDC052020]|uniref:sensor histidine kinase n=1 Tax=Streptomyces sp. NPDC052020 TaxID=3155677 RepID=UPI003431D9C1